VQLRNAALSLAALKAVLVFMYTERLDIPIEEVDAVMPVARKCKLRAVVAAIAAEQRTLKYYFKSTRRGDDGPRRHVPYSAQVLIGGSLCLSSMKQRMLKCHFPVQEQGR
jgi:hypothetical protein